MIRRQQVLLIITAVLLAAAETLLLLTLLSEPSPAHANPDTLYVATTGDDSGNCTNSDTPCRTVQYAVDVATLGDEILVSTGVYTGVQVRGEYTQVVYISKTVAIRGGYTTTNWSTSHPISYPTTLDAQRLGRVMVISGTISATVEALRITGGDAVAGAGVLIRESDSAMLAGNAIYSNTAATGGGGLYLYRSDSVVLQENRIYNNDVTTSTGSGAGVFLAESSGGVFQGNHVWGNSCDYWGGGLLIHTSTTTTVRNNAFYLNEAGPGGGVFIRSSTNTFVDRNAIFSNSATGRGGGIFLRASDVVLTNNFIVENEATAPGGGMALDSGGLLTPTIGILLHNTFAANGDNAVSVGLTSTLRLTNTIVCSHTLGIVVTQTAVATATSTLWWATSTYTDNSGGGSIFATGDRTGDPAFVGGEATADMRAYHITHLSAARNAGESTQIATDYDGDPRPVGPLPDTGADEYVCWVYLPLMLRNF